MKNRNLINLAILFFLLLPIFISCAKQKAEWGGTIEEENGVKVIKNPMEPLWGKFKLNLSENLSIGNENDPQYMFWSVKDIAVDRNADIYVCDMRNYRVQRFDSHGKYIQSIGRLGQGPGEFQLPTIVRIDDHSGNLYVKDYAMFVVVFNKHGEYVKRLTLEPAVNDFIVNDNENLVAVLPKTDPDELTSIQALCKINPQEEIAETHGEFPYPISVRRFGEGTMLISTGYESSLHIAKLDEEAFVYGHSGKYELFISDWSGNVLLKITKDQPPPKFSREERRDLQRTPALRSIPLRQKPYFFNVMCDSQERIYVQRNNPSQGFPGKGAVDVGGKDVDVFSKDGRFIYETCLPANTFIIKDGFLYSYETNDETGLESVKRFKINNWEQMKTGI